MPENIVAPRVPLTDPRTGLISREWYLFFFALYDLVLSSNSTSIVDLQQGPEDAGVAAQLAEVVKALQSFGVTPSTLDTSPLDAALQALGVAPLAPVDTADLTAAIQALQVLSGTPDTLDLAAALQGLQVGPPLCPLTPADLPPTAVVVIQGTPTITVGAEVANVIRVGVQLKDLLGTNLATETACQTWISDTPKGAVTATAPAAVTIGTSGIIIYSPVAAVVTNVMTNSSGFFDLDITYVLARTYYLNLEYQGKVFVSGAITFV